MTDFVYQDTVDGGAYEVRVERSTEHTGQLVVERIERSGCREQRKVLLRETVGLMYGAIFGPDVSDVSAWQHKAITVIDADYAERGVIPPQ